MDLLIFVILYAVCTVLIMLVTYYKRLFSDNRNEYKRNELTGLKNIFETEWGSFFKIGEKPFVYYAFAIGTVVGFLISYMGGLYGAHYESLFFHSALFSLLLFFFLPKAKEGLLTEGENTLFWQKLVQSDTALFIGFNLSILSKTLMVYGIYHAISFLWVLINVLVILALILLRIWMDEGIINSPKDLLKHTPKTDKDA